MSETNWNDLARRCEEATGADSAIDEAISRAVSYPAVRGWTYRHYTSSLDAITARIERELPGHAWSIVHRLTTSSIRPNGQIWTREERSTKHGDAATPALALCAAFCRAMASHTKDTPHE